MNKNSGYHGFSMSNRAVEAYANGEKPLSRWTKGDILDMAEEMDYTPDEIKLLESLPLSVLKSKLLYCSSWHHTSKFCNVTQFYSLYPQGIVDIASLVSTSKKRKE